MPGHQSLRLQNFTVFKDATLEFCEGINIFVGPNGTGKTHAMKVLFNLQLLFGDPSDQPVDKLKLSQTFQIHNYNDLIRHGNLTSELNIIYNNVDFEYALTFRIFHYAVDQNHIRKTQHSARPVFIPSIDMMSHTRKFLSTYDEYNIDFDYTHRDIVSLLLSPEKRSMIENPPAILKDLEKILGGEVEEEGERFYLKTAQGRHPMPLVADGMRKIATLYQLIKNGWLEPGAVLFWDEPETHLNPTLMDEIVGILLELARSGVQIFLATHNYVILKEFDLQAAKEDAVRYFSFELTPEDGAKVSWTEDYAQISPNPIAEQFDFIYNREIDRALGVRRK